MPLQSYAIDNLIDFRYNIEFYIKTYEIFYTFNILRNKFKVKPIVILT